MEKMDDYWMAVISSEDDGLIRFFGRKDEEYFLHLEVLKDYLYTYYNDLAKQIGADDLHTNEEIIIYLNTLGNIVYLHSAGYGLIYMPKEVSDKQIESLYQLLSSFPKTPIYIDYNLMRKNGKIVPQEIINSDDSLGNTQLLDKFLNFKSYTKKVK